ncbi:MAG: FtsX-like permease family protein [Asgard group archaeon]|nr:FtsX-like permease family protein [Asgard group archaeon]
MGKFEEQFKLNLRFISSNRRLAIVTIIGLSISIAMVCQNILFLNNFRNSAFDEFSTTISNTYIDAQIEKVRTDDPLIETLLANTIQNEIEDSQIEPRFYSHQNWITFRFFYLLLENVVTSLPEFHDTYIVGVNQTFLELLSPLITEGRVPGQGEFCIVTDTRTIQNTNLDLNDTFEVYIQKNDQSTAWESYDDGIGESGQYIDFTGLINFDNVIFGSIPIPDELSSLVNLVTGLGKNLIITNFINLPSYLNGISNSDEEYSLLGRIAFNLGEFNVFRLDEHIRSLQVFTNNLQESLLSVVAIADGDQNRIELTLYPWIIPLLTSFRQEYRIFQIFLMAFMLPTLGMSLTLTSFASNQVRKQRDLHINTYHQRGASRKMLFLFMLFELVIFSMIAVLIGFLIGWPYTLVALKSDSFFSFAKVATMPTQLSALIIGVCLGAGFGIAWLSNIFSLWRKTKVSVEEALQERVEKKPFWERFYVDIFLLAVGVIMFVTSINQIGSSTNVALEFAFYFAAPAPILIMIGGIMLITRIYPYFVQGFSKLLFKIPRLEISAVSAKNAIRRKGSTTRTIILMSLTFALTVASMIIPDSYQAYDLEDAYYTLGADIVVEGVDILSPSFKDTVEEIDGIEATTYISILELSDTESGLSYQIKIMGVELDNYSKVAYEESEYTYGRGIAALLPSIVNETDVIGQTNQIEQLNLGENNTFTFRNFAEINGTVGYVQYSVDIVEFFQYWPTLYDRVPQTTDNVFDFGLIGNLTLPYLIARNDFDVEGKLLVKVATNHSISDVARQIELQTRYNTDNVIDLILISEGSLKATVLFGALNSSFIVSMLISSATLITMMIVQGIEREREIALLKSFGINARQLFNFFISEAVIILLFTMIVGTCLGIGSSIMIMRVLRIGANIPQHEMIYPAVKIIWTTLAIFGCGLISTILPIIVNTRKKISGAMRTV